MISDAAFAHHSIFLGKTRAGKSSAMRVVVERLLDQKKPVGIIDPKGDWWGLKSSADGKKPGYGVVIFGGDHADVPIDEHSGQHVAELVATGNRPFIIDLGGWMVAHRTRFFVDFASTLFRLTRGPRWLVIDECHNFAPQGRVLDPSAGKMLHWTNRLASEGAGKGITLLSASQRPQKVHKDYVTSHETLVAMRVIHVLDRNAVKEWIDGAPDTTLGKQVMGELASLARGEAWVWSPEAGFGPERVKFPLFSTYDSFAAPKSETTAKLKGWASVDLDDVRAKLATVVEKEKANDPRLLSAEIGQLKRQIDGLKSTTVPAYPDLRAEVARLRAAGQSEEARANALQKKIDQIGRIIGAPLPAMAAEAAVGFAVRDAIADGVIKGAPVAAPPEPARRTVVAGEKADVPSGCAKPLAALAAMYPGGMTEGQWSAAAGYKKSGGTWKEYRSRLRRAEMIEFRDGQYYATALGAASAGDVELPPAAGPELARWWGGKISGTPKMVEALIAAWPAVLSRQDLGDRLEMVSTGGTFKEYLSRLKRNGIVVDNGGIRLSANVMGER